MCASYDADPRMLSLRPDCTCCNASSRQRPPSSPPWTQLQPGRLLKYQLPRHKECWIRSSTSSTYFALLGVRTRAPWGPGKPVMVFT